MEPPFHMCQDARRGVLRDESDGEVREPKISGLAGNEVSVYYCILYILILHLTFYFFGGKGLTKWAVLETSLYNFSNGLVITSLA